MAARGVSENEVTWLANLPREFVKTANGSHGRLVLMCRAEVDHSSRSVR